MIQAVEITKEAYQHQHNILMLHGKELLTEEK